MAKNKTTVYTLTFGEKILYGLLLGFTYIISLLPMPVLYFLADGIYALIYKCVGYRVKLVRKNLKDSFPDKSEAELRSIEEKFYHWLADYVMETVKMVSVSKEEMKRRVTISHVEVMNEAEDAGQSVAAFLGHYCNWEWVTAFATYMRPETYSGQVYHVLESRVSDKFFLRLRQRMGSHCVAMSEILRRRVEIKRDNKVMIMGYMADQAPFWNNIHYWTTFLNHPDTPVLTGAETIAKRFGDMCIYLDVSRPKRGYYHIDIKLLAADSSNVPDFEITEAYNRAMEESIQRKPEFWLWTHNRWKRTREEYNKMINPETGRLKMQ